MTTKKRTADQFAIIIQCASNVAIAWFTAARVFGESVVLWYTLITVFASYQLFTSTFAGVFVAALVVYRAQKVACALATAIFISLLKIPITILAEN